jgi:hypothetical protein
MEVVFHLEVLASVDACYSKGHRLPLIGSQWECGPWNWRSLFTFIIAIWLNCHLSDYARIMPTLPTLVNVYSICMCACVRAGVCMCSNVWR